MRHSSSDQVDLTIPLRLSLVNSSAKLAIVDASVSRYFRSNTLGFCALLPGSSAAPDASQREGKLTHWEVKF